MKILRFMKFQKLIATFYSRSLFGIVRNVTRVQNSREKNVWVFYLKFHHFHLNCCSVRLVTGVLVIRSIREISDIVTNWRELYFKIILHLIVVFIHNWKDVHFACFFSFCVHYSIVFHCRWHWCLIPNCRMLKRLLFSIEAGTDVAKTRTFTITIAQQGFNLSTILQSTGFNKAKLIVA